MNKKAVLKKYTGKGGLDASGIRQMRMADDKKINLKTSDLPSPFSAVGSATKNVIGSAAKNFAKGVKTVFGAGTRSIGKVMDSVEGRMKGDVAAKALRDNKMKTENWGSPENYDKLQSSVKKEEGQLDPKLIPKKGVLKSIIKKAVPVPQMKIETEVPLKKGPDSIPLRSLPKRPSGQTRLA
jgi:hypothetical protein